MTSRKRMSCGAAICAFTTSILVLFVLASTAVLAQGPTLTVCPDNSGGYVTIQGAIDAAPAGAVIELCDGIYEGLGNCDLVLGDRFLTIRSASGDPAACVIDCGGTALAPHRGFLFQAVAGPDTCAVVEGITVRNGWADSGGGIRCESANPQLYGGGPLLRNCRIVACEASSGGGISVDRARLYLEDCDVSGNTGGNLVVDGGVCRAADCRFDDALQGDGLNAGRTVTMAEVALERCRFENNSGSGLSMGPGPVELQVDSCTMAHNAQWGLSGGDFAAYATIRGCRIVGNGAGGASHGNDTRIDLFDCEIADNGFSAGGSGLDFRYAMGQSATRCLVRGNAGDGVRFNSAKDASKLPQAAGPITDCTIVDNGGWGISAAGYLFSVEVSGTLIAGNGAGGCALALDPEAPSSPAIRSSTIAGNGGPGVRIVSPQPVTIEKTIIAFNTGEAIAMLAVDVPTLSCSDLYGNVGGDWSGLLASQLGTAGNFAADPLFCDPEDGSFRLASDSPAAPAQTPAGCDLVGALPVGCQNAASTVPHIVSIADIAADQGLWVRVRWNRDPRDTLSSTVPIARYVVWRRVDGPAAAAMAGRLDLEMTSAGLIPGDPPLLRAHEALWEPVGPEVPAMGWAQYASVVPTLADSTAAGIAWSVFMISAHAVDPQLFFLSAPDSGYSIDNLTPAAPLGFAVAYAAAGNSLQWQTHTAPDFVAFRIYRGEGNSFTLSEATLVQTTSATEWIDPVADPWRWGYRITAVDDSGLESAAAMPAAVTGVPGGGGGAGSTAVALPLWPVLHAPTPNPFNPRTAIGYALPAGGADVRLEIFDLRGRRLRLLAAGFQPAGRHEAIWDGADGRGRPLPTGVYFCRLQAAKVSEVRKLSLVR